jgi:solute carrier family 9B (sodium/hydrogen exchanger), member 1/2
LSLSLLAVLVVVGGWVTGRLAVLLKLPGVLGMTLWGVLVTVLWSAQVPGVLWQVAPFLKSVALVIILLRAGLGIRRATLQKIGKTAVLLAIIPCSIEALSLTFLLHWFLDFSWITAAICGTMLAAVSPAVVVPAMLELQASGLGKKNDVPTTVLAGASLDDVFVITVFLALLQLHGGVGPSLFSVAWQLPLSIAGGVGLGLITGLAIVWLFNTRRIVTSASEKVLITLFMAILLAQAGEWLHLATLLGVMTVGFILLEKSPNMAQSIAAQLGKLWVPAEIILFVLIGMSLDVSVAMHAGLAGAGIILGGLLFRSFGVWLATLGSGLSHKERWFCVIAYWPKATVQAALGAVPLAAGVAGGDTILAMAVLAILITAPLGLLGIRIMGPKLLA